MKKFFLYDSLLGDRATSWVLLLLRVAVGVMMLTHGWAKVMNYGQMSASFVDFLGLGSRISFTLSMLAEAGCSLLLILGVFPRIVVLPLIVNMSVAVFIAHHGAPFQVRELAVHYLVSFIVIFFLGGGRIALSAWLMGRCCKKKETPPAVEAF